MTKKQSVLSAPAGRTVKKEKRIRDKDIDYSDIPPLTDEQLRTAWRPGRPVTGQAKEMISIRVAPQLLEQLKKLAGKRNTPYQTFIHELLEKAVKELS